MRGLKPRYVDESKKNIGIYADVLKGHNLNQERNLHLRV